jgi:hypothetical protein
VRALAGRRELDGDLGTPERGRRLSCMAHLRRRVGLVAAIACCLGSNGCTVVKPVIGAAVGMVAGPAFFLAGSNGNISDCGCDGRGIIVVLATTAAVGAAVGGVVGLVTGVISDVRWMCGCDEPMANWWDPFKINDEVGEDEIGEWEESAGDT